MIKRIVKIFFFILLIFGGYKAIQIHHDVKQVMQYRSLVREVLAEEDTTANENLILALNAVTESASPAEMQRLRDIFVNCSRYELAFWDMAWQQKKE